MKKVLVIIFSLLTFSCASSKKDLQSINFDKYEFFYIKNGDQYHFYFVINPILNQLSDTINFENIKLTFSSNITKDKPEFVLNKVFSAFHQNTENTFQQLIIYYDQISEKELNGIDPNNLNVEAYAYQKKTKYSRKNPLNSLQLKPHYEKLEFLKLYPKLSEISPNILKFELFAIRVVPHSGEYLPSSEVFRTEIYNYKTGKILNSSEGKNFLQVLTDVEPKVVGEYKIYETQIDLTKFYLLERNLIKFIIPAVPNKYSVEINYWKK